MRRPKVIILTGPCGVGKTTISKLLLEQLDLIYISGDEIAKGKFPAISYITEHPEKLQIVKRELYDLSRTYFFDHNKAVLIDYVILGRDYIAEFQQTFKSNLILKVLLPDRQVIVQRDRDRACWESGKDMINNLYDKYIGLKEHIGAENYIDSGKQTAQETVDFILQQIIEIT